VVNPDSNAWLKHIQKNIYQVLALLFLLTLLIASYRAYEEYTIGNMKEKVESYHFQSQFHTLKAIKYFGDVQINQLTILAFQIPDNNILHSDIALINSRIHTSTFLAFEQVQLIIKLQGKYNERTFAQMIDKLKKLSANQKSEINMGISSEGEVKEFLNILSQLEKLHSIIINQHKNDINQLSNNLDYGFLFIFFCALAAGIYISRHGLLAVKAVLIQHQKTQEYISHQAHYDFLTDLPNRFLAHDRLVQLTSVANRNKYKLAVMFIDLDDFKKINDSLGHDVGDQVLIEVSKRLAGHSRACDTVARLGGDEFVVILSEIKDENIVSTIAKELIEKISKKYVVDKKELIITASIGISIFPENGTKPFDLLRKADSAMYHSKSIGRNTFSFFSESMNILASRKVKLEEELFYAIEKHELSLHFQPKLDLKTNRIIGAEALLRWYNPELGIVSPDEFIAIAEQSNLIVKIGNFVIDEAFRVASKCRKKYDVNFQIAINLSPNQFRDASLVGQIKQRLSKYQIPSELVEFEITEGVLMDGISTVQITLTDMHELGVKLSMDDFGTGYSSLSYLKKFPFDIIKIDKSFVMNMENSPADRTLVKAAISMARSLELKVVAEGIENIEQLNYIKSYGCEYGQGYLFSRPLPEKEFYKLLKSKQPVF